MKRNLLKSALLALMVLVGGNAWAQATTYFSQDYEADGATADWTTGTAGRFTPVILEDDGNHYLSVDQGTRQNNGCVLTSTSLQDKVAAGTDFTMTFDVKIGSSNNQSPVEFNIYDAANSAKILGLVATGVNATEYIINGNSTQKAAISAGSKGISDLTWMEVKLSRNGSLTYLTITDKATSSVVFARDMITTLSETGGLGKMQFITKRYNANFAIDNVVVREIQDGDVPAATPTNYTIKFVDQSSNTIKNDVVIGTIVGTEVSAAADYTAAIYVNDKKYIYVSGNNAITTVENEANNVITLVFREAATWNYTVNATGAESAVIKELASGKAFEEDAVTVPYPLYINVNGTLWTKEATNQEYRASVILNNENTVANWAYTATEKNNVIYCSEGEDISGMTISTNGNLPIRGSNAKGGVSSEDVVITTLSAGKYKLHVGTFTSKSSEQNIYIGYGETQIAFASKGNLSETASNEIVLTAETEIKYFGTTSSADAQLDYLWIEKTGDIFDPETAIVNPSFEADGEKAASNGALELTGWTFDGVGTQFNNTELRPAGSESTTSQFGTSDPSEGNYSLFIRQGWNGNGNVITLTSDAMATLPAGAYILSVDYKQYYSYDKDNQANQNTKLGLSVVDGENTVASTTSPAADGVIGGNVNTYFNDTDWSTLELPFTLDQELVDGNVVITFNMCGARRSDFFVDNVKLIQVPAIDGALAELKKAIDAAQALADSYAIGEVMFTYPATEITPLTNAISTAQGVYDAAESVDAVTTATQTLNAFVATFAPAMNKPEADKTYTFRLRLDVETPLYMALAESGITIAEQATALKFIETENNGEYYLSNADGTLFVGLAGNNAWTMSTAADKKAAWTFTALPDGAHRINNLVTKGRFVGTNAAEKEAGKPCYADKQTSNGNVDWIIEVTKIPTGIKTMKAGRESEEIYNLNGQKVMKAQKGLYIINGKKVVVK
ncbi:hypothetical protein L6475_12265 [Prevotella sp. E9-3]|uniref:hypothetical protein n=1 Tax=Prevotella sp. E9-3 TaxID=2913621 RepID=UPI001EDB3D29|nr:hypothetical protein [Prevotella sp. E9-3]UKK47967.1 hypothetical protein L6475_12265 [Prevotella sp. E9-3]